MFFTVGEKAENLNQLLSNCATVYIQSNATELWIVLNPGFPLKENIELLEFCKDFPVNTFMQFYSTWIPNWIDTF